MMAEAVPLDPKRAFFAPQFRIKLKGQDIGRAVVADITEVTYSDDEANLDSFEFSLADWDPIARRPKYSSPWDQQGKAYKIGDKDAPNFEPGADVELTLAYVNEGEPVVMMRGEVVSITPTFPASGPPTCRVRALNYLYRLQREKVTGTFTGSKMDIARQIATKVGIKEVKMPPAYDWGESLTDVLNNAVAYEEIVKRARESGLVPWLEDDPGGPILHFEATAGDKPVATLTWGRNLVSFAPQLSTRGIVEKVVVRGADPKQKGKKQQPEGVATWADIGVKEESLGPLGMAEVKKALKGVVETIDDAEIRTEAAAKDRAIKELEKIASELIRATGSSIGLPELRSGRVIEILGLGPRFSGMYRLSQTTHSLGASGYSVSFQARKLLK
jgi:phage protein D